MSVTGQEYYYYELKLRLVHLLLRYSINLIFFTNNLSVLTRVFCFSISPQLHPHIWFVPFPMSVSGQHSSNNDNLLLEKRRNNVSMGGWYVNVQTPFPPEGFSTMLAVHLFVDSFFTFMDGSYVFCHMSLPGEHFIAVWTGNAFDSAMFGLS